MKKYLHSILLTLFLLSACSNEEYDQAMDQGIESLGNEEYHQAAVYFERAKQEEDDKEANAYYQQATAMDEANESYNQQAYDQTLTSLELVLEVNQGLDTVQKEAEKMKEKILKERELTASLENYLHKLEQDIEKGNTENAKQTYEKLKGKLEKHPSLQSYQSQLSHLQNELESLLEESKDSQLTKEPEPEASEAEESAKESAQESETENDKEIKQETSPDQEESAKQEESYEENDASEPSNEEETEKEQEKEPDMTYTTYSNERFGFSFEYPDFLSMAPPPTNGDGVELYSNDGLELTAYGAHVLDPSKDIDDYYNEATAELKNIAYQKKTDDWFVLSYKSGDQITYSKFYLGESQLNSLTITYPDSQKEKYDPITTRISKSFSSNTN
ncbi:hypothetical protein [Halobacillus halophilus]|uniref:hypothetical protein n=1 Tax=Halobacillus halophilus TaxID=1570 RepID=UPI001CD7C649|nr:hypothetical protein [Halobacillus halophilus]MCA1011513.1 hypothetical protein [Halobacillus halophilus]